MISKTGSHVSMIISFVVFVTFIVFLFFILQPALNVGDEKDAFLDSIETGLLGYLSSELNTISIKSNQAGNCVQLSGLEGVNSSLIVKNANGDVLNYDWISAGNLKIENDGVNKFFKIYESYAISPQETSIGSCTPVEYTFGLIKTEEKIFEKNILDAMTLYQTNYDQLRQNIGLVTGDFGFDFVYENGTILSKGESAQTAGVSTKQSSFNYLDANLNNLQGNMVIKTW